MAKSSTFRFAAGSLKEPYSGIWRLVCRGDDVYMGGPSRSAMGTVKVSLHESGVWTFAATSQSGIIFADGNRRAKRWERPLEHVEGVTRGPSVIVPHTSVGSRQLMPEESGEGIRWYPPPSWGEHVEFSLYFAAPDASTKWSEDEEQLYEKRLKSGQRVIVLGSCRPTPADFARTVETLLRDFEAFKGGSSVWITQSADKLQVPLLVDFPIAGP